MRLYTYDLSDCMQIYFINKMRIFLESCYQVLSLNLFEILFKNIALFIELT